MMLAVKFVGDMMLRDKMLAVKNGEKPSLGIFQTRLLFIMDLQYITLNMGFTIFTSNYMI